ncbi:hypothetical protein QYE76_000367 [Lolium multiflorum]|uniref:CCHC-type domain-containing protein n=1 Tax=Lolium multiflorum TaxID=4521 RepID=A0AAD8RL06_LOLMU|nr:hypothetical protein QYE76_000367 [Lolium multiflorum]
MNCHTCDGKGHFKRDCPNHKVMFINDNDEYETGDDADPDAPEDDDYDSDGVDAFPSEARTIVVSQRALNVQPSASTQRYNLFQTKALVGSDKACKESHAGGGHGKTLLMLADHFYWPNMRQDVDRFPKLRKSKLLPRGAGPYKVLAKINDNAYSIDLPTEFGVGNSFNVANLTPYDGEDLGASRSTPFEGEMMRTSLPNHYLCHYKMKTMLLYDEGASIARGEEEQLDVKLDMELHMKLDMKRSHGRARKEREACAREGDQVQASAQPGQTGGRHAGMPSPRRGPTEPHAGSTRRSPDPAPVSTGRVY